jgi:hypothetical protein
MAGRLSRRVLPARSRVFGTAQTPAYAGVAMLLDLGLYDSARVLVRVAYETAIDLAYLITVGNKVENAFR